MKEIILNSVTMKEILQKYNIKQNKDMFSCPFHGSDKHPSAKAYKNSFYCFNCNKTGDIIQFVQYLFGISFQEAMQKINVDFNLNLSNNDVNYEIIKEKEKARKDKIKLKEELINKYIKISEEYRKTYDFILKYKKEINILNWEDVIYEISKQQEKLELIEIILNDLEYKLQYLN